MDSLFFASLLLFFGVYVLYHISKKTVVTKNNFTRWLQKYYLVSKTSVLLTIIIGFYVFITNLGAGVGVFFALVVLMLSFSLLILLFPLFVKK